jgi:hypothetical protein
MKEMVIISCEVRDIVLVRGYLPPSSVRFPEQLRFRFQSMRLLQGWVGNEDSDYSKCRQIGQVWRSLTATLNAAGDSTIWIVQLYTHEPREPQISPMLSQEAKE